MEIRIAFYKGKGNWKNKVIRWWTKSPYSHAELVLPDEITWVSISPFLTSTVSARSVYQVKNLEDWDFLDFELSWRGPVQEYLIEQLHY